MIDHSLRVALCHSATARAHLVGAEAAELDARAKSLQDEADNDASPIGAVLYRMAAACRLDLADAARRRYWRELEACELLKGRQWPEAETLGAESTAPVSISQEG